MNFYLNEDVFSEVNSLEEIYNFYRGYQNHLDHSVVGGDKGTIHSYIGEYSRIFNNKRKNVNFLEIGIHYGLSMKMWEEYFIDSKLYGLDITDYYINQMFPERNFDVIVGSSYDQEILNNFLEITFDIIIDDGDHTIESQVKTFEIFKHKMNKNGIYVIEDILNLDKDIDVLKSLHSNCEIIDKRKLKNRYDDVLAVYRF